MLSYSDVRSFLDANLRGLGYSDANPPVGTTVTQIPVTVSVFQGVNALEWMFIYDLDLPAGNYSVLTEDHYDPLALDAPVTATNTTYCLLTGTALPLLSAMDGSLVFEIDVPRLPASEDDVWDGPDSITARTTGTDLRLPLFDPGPYAIPTVRKKTPGPMVVATVGNGAGLELEQTYDQVFVTVRVLGPQGDYDAAERLAYDLDRLLLAVNSPAMIGDTRVLSIVRSGGAPQLIDYGDDQRYQFQATYVARGATGL